MAMFSHIPMKETRLLRNSSKFSQIPILSYQKEGIGKNLLQAQPKANEAIFDQNHQFIVPHTTHSTCRIIHLHTICSTFKGQPNHMKRFGKQQIKCKSVGAVRSCGRQRQAIVHITCSRHPFMVSLLF